MKAYPLPDALTTAMRLKAYRARKLNPLLLIRKKLLVRSRSFVLIPLASQRHPIPLKLSAVGWIP
jgi:hypothetical protein